MKLYMPIGELMAEAEAILAEEPVVRRVEAWEPPRTGNLLLGDGGISYGENWDKFKAYSGSVLPTYETAENARDTSRIQ